jgi:ADP-heptose:LPS heptosyltransferase
MRRLTEFFVKKSEQSVRGVVFIKLVEQGSTVLTQSAIRRAIELVGRDNVYFLVFEENRFILDAMSLIPSGNVLPVRQNNLIETAADIVRAIATLRKRGVNAVIDLEFFARSSAALCFLSGARYRVGFHAMPGEGPYRGDLMTHRLRYNPYLHTSQTFRTMVEALTFSPGRLLPFDISALPMLDPSLRIEPLPGELEEVKALLRNASGTTKFQPLIVLNPNCSDLLPLRRWPAERYVELARRLIQLYPQLHVAMTGTQSEKAKVELLVKQVGSDRCFSLAGRTALRQLLVLYGLAEVLVTNDSGPAHFAALTTIDVVTLFGPETPRLFAALTPRNHVFWEGIACSPCVSALNQRESNCRDNVCMQRIDTDRVFEMVCRVYEARRDALKLDRASSPPGREESRG